MAISHTLSLNLSLTLSFSLSYSLSYSLLIYLLPYSLSYSLCLVLTLFFLFVALSFSYFLSLSHTFFRSLSLFLNFSQPRIIIPSVFLTTQYPFRNPKSFGKSFCSKLDDSIFNATQCLLKVRSFNSL